MSRAREIAAYAARIHLGQKDLQGRPYYEHLKAVAWAAQMEGGHSAYVVGMLHDSVEDGKATFADLRTRLDDDELIAVGLLTRTGEPYGEYVERIRSAPGTAGILARIVKLADLRHNLGRLTARMDEKRPDLRARYESAVEVLEAERLVT